MKLELCGIEFPDLETYREFRKIDTKFTDALTLTAGTYVIVLFKSRDYPTRDIEEIRKGVKFIGPDALKYTYQIQENDGTVPPWPVMGGI